MTDESSPDILKRLRKLPPYGDVPPEVEPEAPIVPEVKPEEPAVETPEPETPVETPTEPETPEVPEEEVSEEEALANSKNPERTKKYIESLKKKITPEPSKEPETPKPHVPDALSATEPEVMVDQPVVIPQVPMPREFASPQNYPNLSQKKIDDIIGGLMSTDEDGNQLIDMDKLRVTLAEANREVQVAHGEAQEAKQIAQRVDRKFSDFEKTKEVQSVHSQFPELDPESGVFNEKYYDAVVNEMYVQLVKTGKRDFSAAAQKWVDNFRKEAIDVNKKEKQKLETDTNAKKQINATGSHSNGQQRTGWDNHEELVSATRKGEKGALQERLRRAGQ